MDKFIFLIFAALFLGFCLGGAFESVQSDRRWRKNSVIAGHAEYITKDGRPEWRWRP